MKFKCFIVLCLLFNTDVFAEEKSWKVSAGLGHQHGGAIGARFGYGDKDIEYFASIGGFGLAAGAEKRIENTQNHSYGIMVGMEVLTADEGFLMLTYNYHPNGFGEQGLVVGTGIGIRRRDEGGIFSDSGNIDTLAAVTLTLGYKF